MPRDCVYCCSFMTFLQVYLCALWELEWLGPAQAAALATAFPTLAELVRFCVDPTQYAFRISFFFKLTQYHMHT